MVVLNLDISRKITPSPYVYRIPLNTEKIYFRIVENDYPINYVEFDEIELVFKGIDRLFATKVVTVGKEQLVEFDLQGYLINGREEVLVDATVAMEFRRVFIGTIKLVTYDDEISSCRESEWRMLANILDNFNATLGRYYNAIKRDQINQPNGVPALDSNGRVSYEQLPIEIDSHPQDLLYDTYDKEFIQDGIDIGIHGLKLDEEWQLTYWDTMDKRRYKINSIYGGEFGIPNKPEEWNIWGGDFGDIDVISGDNFTNPPEDLIYAGDFNVQHENVIISDVDGGGSVDRIKIWGGTW